MKIVVFGAGALGSLMGALLAGRHEVVLVGRPAHVEAIERDGLRVEGVRRIEVRVRARTTYDPEDRPDLVIVSTKSYDTLEAIQALRDGVPPTAVLLTIQNGLGNYEALREAFPRQPVLAMTIVAGAVFDGPGRIRFAGAGEQLLGGTPNDLSVTSRIARVMREAGLQALGVPDIRGPLWQKAIVNAAFNPVSALTGKRNGELLEDPSASERMRRIADEGARVARALRVPLPEKDPWTVIERVARATPENKTSMLQDVERGRRTEIDAINGAIVGYGAKAGVPTPENEAIVAEIKRLESRFPPREAQRASR